MSEPDTGSIIVTSREYCLADVVGQLGVMPTGRGYELERYPVGSHFLIVQRGSWMLTPTGRLIRCRSLRCRQKNTRKNVSW